jgi:hypothetical protein
MGRQINEDYKEGILGAHSVLLGDTHGKKEWSFRVRGAPLRLKRRTSLCCLNRELEKRFGMVRARWEKARFLAENPLG